MLICIDDKKYYKVIMIINRQESSQNRNLKITITSCQKIIQQPSQQVFNHN
jgi:hypothetical protein